MSSSQDKHTLRLEEGGMEGCSKMYKGTRANKGGILGIFREDAFRMAPSTSRKDPRSKVTVLKFSTSYVSLKNLQSSPESNSGGVTFEESLQI